MDQEKKHRFCIHFPNHGPIMMVILSDEEYQIFKNIQKEEKLPAYQALKKMKAILKNNNNQV
ncbi:MAG: hypothetical protein HC831_04960 [Chloroflexia bacterium]|nr:hypothetical protein [Chloroflexia bacterium]